MDPAVERSLNQDDIDVGQSVPRNATTTRRSFAATKAWVSYLARLGLLRKRVVARPHLWQRLSIVVASS
jgi:hypothetical protein